MMNAPAPMSRKELAQQIKSTLYLALTRWVQQRVAPDKPLLRQKSLLGWIIRVAMIAMAAVNAYYVYHFQVPFLGTLFAALNSIALVGLYVGYSFADVPPDQERNVKIVVIAAMVIEASFGMFTALGELLAPGGLPNWLTDPAWSNYEWIRTSLIILLATLHGVPTTILLFFTSLFVFNSRIMREEIAPVLQAQIDALKAQLAQAVADAAAQAEQLRQQAAEAARQFEATIAKLREDLANANLAREQLAAQALASSGSTGEQLASLSREMTAIQEARRIDAQTWQDRERGLLGQIAELRGTVGGLEQQALGKEQAHAAFLELLNEQLDHLRSEADRLRSDAEQARAATPAAPAVTPALAKPVKLTKFEERVAKFMEEGRDEDFIVKWTSSPMTTVRPAMARVRTFWEQTGFALSSHNGVEHT